MRIWRPTDWAKTREPLYKLFWKDYSEEEFAEALALYPDLEERGYFVSVELPDEPSPRRRRSDPDAPPETTEPIAEEGTNGS